MAPSRRKGANKASSARRQWKIGDLVLAKLKGFPAWPARVTEPEKWGYSGDGKKVLVCFFGTQQIAFCNPADVEEFNEVKKESLLVKRRGKGADFFRALHEIIDCYEKLKRQNQDFSATCDEETIESNENNPAESLSASETNDEAVTSPRKIPLSAEATSDLHFLTEAAVAAAAEDALRDEEMRVQVAGHNLDSTDSPMSTSYHVRDKVEISVPRKGVGQITFARRCRNSRIDLDRLQNGILTSVDNTRGSRDRPQNGILTSVDNTRGSGRVDDNAVRVRSLRRSRRIMKSFDDSDRYYTESPVSESNESIEEGSGMLTVDTDTLSFKQGSTGDYPSKLIQPVAVAENCELETKLSDRLDFQTNTSIIKKREMPSQKRLSNDTAESEAKVGDLVFGADIPKAEHVLCSDDEKLAERYTKEDGDEHLPLVKRARVRMGRLTPALEERSNSMHTEDKISDISRSLTIQPSGSLFCNEGGAPEKFFLIMLGETDNPPLPRTSPGKEPQIETRKNFLDCEAALPPCKRLHRALEAMSANEVEKSQMATEYPSAVTSTTDIHYSSGDCSMKVEDPCNDVSDSGTSQLDVPLNREMSGKNTESFTAAVDCIKPSDSVDISNSELCKLFNPAEGADRKESSPNEHSAEVNVSETNITLESPNLAGPLTSADCHDCSLDLLAHPTDSCETECSLLANDLNGPSAIGSEATLVEETTVHLSQGATGMHTDSVDGNGHESSKSQHVQLAETKKESQESKIDKEAGLLLTDSNAMASATPVEVIVGCSHQHLLPSNSVSDDLPEKKSVIIPHLSSPVTDGLDNKSLDRGSSFSGNNLSTSPDIQLHLDKAKCADKFGTKGDANVALSSFKDILGSLTRTKETILRATHIAIECAKYGFANKVVEMLAHNLENESRLHRKVDLFFLVDSITQCSRGMKGEGGIYPAAIQAILPRLLLAAAPPNISCLENHRQCLKVLKVWQERKILPEPIVRHHIRELDVLCNSYSSWASCRRPSRGNERAFDDPIREMEGMLVDEYGSNSSIQLPGFCMPPMLRVEDGGSDSDEESFEAVTPERKTENNVGDKTLHPVVEKHSHVLKDVDGELEMEDVAPSCEGKISPTHNVSGAQTPHHQSDSHFCAPFAPPHEGIERRYVPRSSWPQPPRSRPRPRPLSPKSRIYSSSQGRRPTSRPPTRASNSIQPPEGAFNKSFLHPPHPSPNQFFYDQDQRVQSRRDISPPLYPYRYHTQDEENVNFYRDRDRLKFPRRDSIRECWKPPLHSVSGPCYSDGARMPHAAMFYNGPREPSLHNTRRDYYRPINHRQFVPYRPFPEAPITIEHRGSNYWRSY